MKNMPTNITTPTIAEIAGILAVLIPVILYLLGRLFDKRKLERETLMLEAESDKSKAEARKVESEVAQNIVASANILVGEYKEMLESLNKKYIALDERLVSTEKRLDEEIKKRIRGEKITIELFHGFNAVLEQLRELNITPNWVPDEKLTAALKKLEEDK